MDEKRLVDGTTALAEKQARVIKIEPTERPQNVRLRVAAYTRVSSDSEDQLNNTQINDLNFLTLNFVKKYQAFTYSKLTYTIEAA